MKKLLKILFCIVFILMITLPTLSMMFGDGKVGADNAEKRELAAMPVFKKEDGSINSDFFAEFDDYMSDNFGFRSFLVNAFSTVKASVFKTSSEEDVIIGKDDWLFYSETLDDYTRNGVLSKDDIYSIGKTLDLINEYVESKGGKLVFFIAPNKNTIYPEKMPYYYRKGSGSSNLELLSNALADRAYYLNIVPILEEGKKTTQIYHSLDSHWNNMGAAIGFNAMMDKLNVTHTDYTALSYNVSNSHKGDLEKMLYPTSKNLDAQVHFDYKNTYEYATRFKTEEDVTIKTICANKEGSAVIYRDSFCNALLPMIAESFGKAEFSRVFPYRLNLVEKNESEYVVIELVERNIKKLIESAPVMPAPVRDEITKDQLEVLDAEVATKKSGGMIEISGKLIGGEKDDSAPKNKPIFVTVKDENTETVYEAFPINGFSAYIPYESTEGLEINICKLK